MALGENQAGSGGKRDRAEPSLVDCVRLWTRASLAPPVLIVTVVENAWPPERRRLGATRCQTELGPWEGRPTGGASTRAGQSAV